ncbi:hypothetical protein BX666DRAFT_2083879 [Dichotomocladium elegans]|nr:hypothetical protein BX666DRAFT_2083879 [Dichotomocladium elegans]
MDNEVSPWSSPSRAPLQEFNSHLPDSPPEKQHHVNSDDLIPTSHIHPSIDDEERVDTVYLSRPPKQPIILLGGRQDITIGRGGNATIKIGKRNRQISRLHARIEYKPESKKYELVVLGLNGAAVGQSLLRQHDRTVLADGAEINILGSRITFMYPDETFMSEKVSFSETQQQPEPTNSLAQPTDDLLELLNSSPRDVEFGNAVKEEGEDAKEAPEPLLELKTEETSTTVKSDAPCAVAEDEEEDKENQHTKQDKEIEVADYAEVIIDALVFSRKSSMPVSDICSRILKTNPSYKSQPREVWIERIQKVLKEKPFFGEIVRKGKTADGSPKENLYYYNSEADPVEWRRAEYTHVGRSARKCTLQDKQYFWKIPPKLGRNRNAYVPPPARAYEQGKRETKKLKLSEDA